MGIPVCHVGGTQSCLKLLKIETVSILTIKIRFPHAHSLNVKVFQECLRYGPTALMICCGYNEYTDIVRYRD